MKKLLMVLSLFCLPLVAENLKIFMDNGNNLAVEGYDVISYFSKGNPELGSNQHQINWQGAVWRFANGENLRRFEGSPEQYAPQFGGYCAWALVDGRQVGSLPNIWTISNGKLYLFCSHEALQKWQEGGEEVIELANKQWSKILQANE